MKHNSSIPFVNSGSYPVRTGNFVRPLIDGLPAFRRICEAIEAANNSVWVTVTFMWESFKMPDARGTTLDVLERAAARDVDVKLIFWRPDAQTEDLKRNTFWGSEEHFEELEQRQSGFQIRWDRAYPGFCQHQKSWLIDAGSENELAFVGGINLNPHSMVAPGHYGEGQNHDAYLELMGPSTVDVHHNFVQRWNEASERFSKDGRWGKNSETNLPFPVRVPAEQGNTIVQIQRTIHPDRYTDGRSTPKGASFDIALGERTIFNQYCAAIGAAQRSIYIENQQVDVPEILNCLRQALQRGVEIVLLMPTKPFLDVTATQEYQANLEARANLGAYKNFTLAGIAGISAGGQHKPVYVHSKLMLIDDVWATLGSCNLHRFSLFGNTEMNATFFNPQGVRALRCELFQEHLGHDTSDMDDRAALQFFRKVAQENRRRFDSSNHEWQGLAFSLAQSTTGIDTATI